MMRPVTLLLIKLVASSNNRDGWWRNYNEDIYHILHSSECDMGDTW